MNGVPESLAGYVSRETYEALEAYVLLIQKWTPKINLVARSQVEDLWIRHIWDSAQIWPCIKHSTAHVDLGSGGGLPGLVLAILAKGQGLDLSVSLIESDIRKAVFLRTVARELGLNVRVHDKRHQFVPPSQADTLTARALTSLDELLAAAERHLNDDGVAVFPKGARWQQEIEVARANWAFHIDVIPSITDAQAALLKIKDITRV
ncbi:MAG: 16S rRNA (guanine(527)-N(7))-methyltransferase RsmG [Pseudomonadota bacterium]